MEGKVEGRGEERERERNQDGKRSGRSAAVAMPPVLARAHVSCRSADVERRILPPYFDLWTRCDRSDLDKENLRTGRAGSASTCRQQKLAGDGRRTSSSRSETS
jgi:hypothetical protein